MKLETKSKAIIITYANINKNLLLNKAFPFSKPFIYNLIK